jgi:hypothetical protein
MSATPPTDPKGAEKESSNALIWAVLSAAFAAFMFYRAFDPAFEKSKGLYLLCGAAAAIMAAVNGYGAWAVFQKAKKPK